MNTYIDYMTRFDRKDALSERVTKLRANQRFCRLLARDFDEGGHIDLANDMRSEVRDNEALINSLLVELHEDDE